MAITGGFGMTMDLERGTTRRWVMGRDGVKRWADTGEPVESDPYCECGGDAFADEEELFSNKCKACGGQLV